MSVIWGDLMDSRGMLPAGLYCLGCGKTLNADGNHPAELYAGTWNGLCYGCTGRGAFVAKTAALDGCRQVSWPPYCPSHRRDRDKFLAYADCDLCRGMGVELSPSGYALDHRRQCGPCLDRCVKHPLRLWHDVRRRRLMDFAQAVFELHWDAAAGVPAKCSGKRRAQMREAFARRFGCEEAWRAYKRYHPVKLRYDRLAAAHARRAERLGLNRWDEPPEVVARFEAMVARRAADLGITESP